jgi:drug/metabolite transporter (DMT)-like permease
MNYLILSILFSSFINLFFRYLKKHDVHLNIVLGFNYVACVLTSIAIEQRESIVFQDFWNEEWFLLSAILGVVFIIIFTYMALTAQKLGVSISATASRMGLVFPVLFGYFYWKEPLNPMAIAGIVLGLSSVVLISLKKKGYRKLKLNTIILPLVIFVGSGFIDTSLNYLEEKLLGTSPEIHPTTIIFLFAGITGLIAFSQSFFKQKPKKMARNALAGLALGVPNFFSIYFLLKALNSDWTDSVIIFPINNISIMLLSTLLSILFFKEHLNKQNRWGVVLASASVVLITLANG